MVEDANWREDSYGEKGEELTLRLILRVVADVGIVGLPNAVWRPEQSCIIFAALLHLESPSPQSFTGRVALPGGSVAAAQSFHRLLLPLIALLYHRQSPLICCCFLPLSSQGKSSLLAAQTRASPEVAPYPFTTLMPNLGVMSSGHGAPVLADLPGLIEGAHQVMTTVQGQPNHKP